MRNRGGDGRRGRHYGSGVGSRHLPSVVQIYHGTPEGGHTAGSGFIMEMTEDTVYLCTNRHVIAKYDDWDVYFL